MKIHDLEFFLAAVAQSDSPTPTRSLLVRITTASGLEGWGESALAWRMGELAPRREALLAVLAGRSVYDIEELHTLPNVNYLAKVRHSDVAYGAAEEKKEEATTEKHS